MKVSIIGAGAFGTSLAITLAQKGQSVTLWARSGDAARNMQSTRLNPRLPGVTLPDQVAVTDAITTAQNADICLLAVPTQQLSKVLTAHSAGFAGRALVACCKGIDIETLSGPVGIIGACVPNATAAMLTGPSFAADIARGLPTALTLACTDQQQGEALQGMLSTDALRLYRTQDTIGAELGGALKNVVAIACGVAIGANLGESARAALMTRGFAEMQRLALRLGAAPETMSGLSGFGDLALTCTSELSRNYRYGLSLGRGTAFDASVTVEGAKTATALEKMSRNMDIDLPICATVNKLVHHNLTVADALQRLMSRPLKEE